MRKIFIVTAVICLTFSIQPVALKNVDSAQKNVTMPSDSTCDWPMFGRTPDGNRVVPDECGIDDSELSEKWTKKISTNDPYRPIIAGDRMFISFQNKVLYCINIENGEVIWKFVLTSYIFTPAYYNNKIYFGSAGIFYCLDAGNGKIVWQVKIPEFKGMSNNCIVYKEKIYFSGDDKYFCLEISDGSTIWSLSRIFTGHNYDGMAIADDNVYLLYGLNDLYCVDYLTGKKKWEYKAEKGKFLPGSNIVLADGKVFYSPGDGLTCLDQSTGKMLWKNDFVNQGVVYYNNQLFISWGLKINVMDPKNGTMIWASDRLELDQFNIAYNNGKIICMRNDASESKLNILDLKERRVTTDIHFKKIATFIVTKSKLILINSLGDVSCYESGYSRTAPNKILIIPNSNIIDTCQTTQLSAKVYNQYDQEIDAPIQWSVDPEFGTIDSSGLFTPKKTGKVKITCKSGNLSESVTIDVIEFLTVNSEGVRIDVVKPKQVASKTIAYTNNSDRKLTVDVVSNLGLVTVSPSSFVIEPGKSQEVSVSAQLASFEPVPDTEFVITASYDTCTKQLKGLLSSSLPFACLAASPDSLAFGMVERGYAKTMSLSILSEVETKISVSTSEAWISVPVKEMTLKAGVPAIISFKIHASSLPSASRLSGNVIIKSDVAFCDTLTIPVTVETEESITIKLKIDSKSATINNQKRDLDAPPKIMGGRTMVPLRFISEAFGCNIEWDAKEQRIGIVRYDISVNLWIGKDYVEVNGQKLKIDSPPIIVAGRTMVPLRFIAEPFGAKVEWNAQTKEITIVWPKP